MSNKEYNRNVTIAIICDVVSLFIFGFIFSSIAYSIFDKNYKKSLDNRSRRTGSILGKSLSAFLLFMSLSYQGQPRTNPLNDRILVSLVTGAIFGIGCFFVLNSKDKKIELEESTEENNEFQCGNCGETILSDDKKCPHCGAIFEEADDDNIDEDTEEENDNNEEDSHELEEEQVEMFKCDNCGALVKDTDIKCPNCGESFEEDIVEEEKSKTNIDQKYSDLNKLKKLLDDKIITKAEFDKEKKKILKD